MPVSFRIAPNMMAELQQHLFPGDHDEHGAVIAASILTTSRGTRLLAHRLFLAEDGVDYVAGVHGYRMLTASFVMDCVLECADLKMAYIAVHCHGGTNTVNFSTTDMSSHERGYPALCDIVDGSPVGGLVFARNAVAGDIWFADGQRSRLDVMVIADNPLRLLFDAPPLAPLKAPGLYDRQARLLGDRGHQILTTQKVGVIGAGGAGSIVVEHLARLGVGELVLIDPDRIEPSNLSRVVGSRHRDVLGLFTNPRFGKVATWFERLRTSKVRIATRLVREASPRSRITSHRLSVTDPMAAKDLLDCDYLFLAADTMQARLVFNAIVHQYLIPGCQMGVKAQVNSESGELLDLFAVYRPVVPGKGCLWCNGLIPASKLQEEATDPEQLRRQHYVNDPDIIAPSVITMNAIATSMATNGYLMSVTGLMDAIELTWTKHYARTNEFIEETPTSSPLCTECSEEGRLGRGPTKRLPTTFNG